MYCDKWSQGYLVVSLWNQLENLLTDSGWCFRNPIFASLSGKSIFALCKHGQSPDNAFMSPAKNCMHENGMPTCIKLLCLLTSEPVEVSISVAASWLNANKGGSLTPSLSDISRVFAFHVALHTSENCISFWFKKYFRIISSALPVWTQSFKINTKRDIEGSCVSRSSSNHAWTQNFGTVPEASRYMQSALIFYNRHMHIKLIIVRL